MITVIRRYFKSGSQYVLWIIMASFVIGLMPLAIKQMSQSGMWAIRVNGQDVGFRDFMHEANKQQQRIAAIREQYGEYADWLLTTMGMNDPKSLAFRSLVREELINQFGYQLGIHLSSDYIVNQMNNPQFVQEELGHILPPQIVDKFGGINQQLLRQYLNYVGINAEMFEGQIERALMDNVVRSLVSNSFYLPNFDIKQRYATDHSKKSFSILTISKENLRNKESKLPVSDDTLEVFFDEQNNTMRRYMVPEKRSGLMWTFSPENYQITVSDAQIEEYYERNKTTEFLEKPAMVEVRRLLFKVPRESDRAQVQDRIGRLRDEILPNPSQFAEFAKKHSQDAESAARGGLIPAFARGTHEAIFDKTAFLLKQDGEISSVIETSDGYEMLQRVSKTTPVFKSFAQAKKEIKTKLVQQKFNELFEHDMKEIIRGSESESDDSNNALQALIKQKGGKPRVITGQALDKSLVSEHLFKLKPGGVSFYVDENTGIAVQLSDIHEAYIPSFESMKAVVKSDYYDHKTDEALKRTLQEAQEVLKAHNSFSELVVATGGSASKTGWITAGSDAAEALQKKEIPVTQMLQLEKIGAVMAHQSPQAAFIIRLDEIAPFNEEEYQKNKDQFADSFREERLAQYMESFVASLHRNATIETNKSIVTIQD